jgi:hypothetical protein
MSYNGSGTFNINTAGQPVVTGTTITSTAFNLLTADLATGLTTALTKDGQTTPTANIPMGTFKITRLGAGSAATDAAQYGQLQSGATTIATVSGTDTLTGSLTPAIAAYATGNLFSFVAVATNTGAVTINLNSLGAKNITKQGSTALVAGDIVTSQVYLIEYDGTRFQLINPSSSSGVSTISFGSTGLTPSTATNGAVTVAGTLAIANGGTNSTATATAGGVGYGTGTAHAYTTVGTSGYFLQSNGASAPSWVSAPSGGVADNVVVVNTFNSYGSVNTAITNFATLAVNTGSAITYSSSSTLGDSFTITEAGYYLVYTVASVASSVAFGASINSTQLSTAISSITFANRVIAAGGAGSSSFAPYSVASTIIKCAIGDIIRPHCVPGNNQNGTNRDVFIVRKVGNV